MTNSRKQLSHDVILEVAGKLVTVFGFVLGFAYIAGWMYLRSYYGFLNYEWIVELFDTQALIRCGLLWVSYCCLLSGALVVFFKSAGDIRETAVNVFFSVSMIVMLLAFALGVFDRQLDKEPVFQLFGPAMMGACSSFALAAALRSVVERGSLRFMVLSASFGFLWMVIANPWMYAYSTGMAVGYDKPKQTIVIVGSERNRFVLFGVVSGKYILGDCKSRSVSIVEPDATVAVQSAKGNCE